MREEEECRGNERARELMKWNSSVGSRSGSGMSSGDVFEETEREGGGLGLDKNPIHQ
jgi:hypothetical protein